MTGSLSHAVPQVRFLRKATFEIDVRDEHTTLVEKIRARGGRWSQWFGSGRGVELSKSGRVVCCRSCGHAWPLPRTPRLLTCRVCGVAELSSDLPVEVVVQALGEAGPGWVPLIAGVDVNRYRCAATHAIRTGVPGINYKVDQPHDGERILVRKTGVGLRAAVTAERAYTTQVVFHYEPDTETPEFLASYVQGVLASRAMLAYHLLVNGENEWRSHPYVTQQVIPSLPVPDPVSEPAHRVQAKKIADAARAHASAPSADRDLAIEALVVHLFGLDRKDVAVVASVLDNAQDLEGIRELRFDPTSVATQIG